jgi:hypothetical protein
VRWFAAAAALAILGLVPTAGTTAIGPKPRLVLLDRSPVVVRGVRFHAREAVRVRAIVRGGPRLAKSVTASRQGVFTARFVSLSLRECAFFTAQATGARGSRAAFTLHPPPCGPAP